MKKILSLVLCMLLLVSAVIPGGFTVLQSPATTSYIQAQALTNAEMAANEKIIYDYCSQVLGLNTAACVAILANVEKECHFDPNNWGDNGNAYGIFQWNYRRANLFNWCSANNLNVADINAQLGFFRHELTAKDAYSGNGYYNEVYTYLKNVPNTAQGAYDAAYYFASDYEQCTDSQFTPRAVLARDSYWPKYSKIVDPTITNPLPNAQLNAQAPGNLTWNAVPNALSYRYTIRRIDDSGTTLATVVNNALVASSVMSVSLLKSANANMAEALRSNSKYEIKVVAYSDASGTKALGQGVTVVFYTTHPDSDCVSLEVNMQSGQNGIVAVDIYIDNASNLQLNALNLSLSYDESVFSIKDENPPEFDEPFYSIVQILSNFIDFDISEAWKINTETDGTVTVTTSFSSLFPTIIKSLDSQGFDSDHIRLATIYLSMNDKSDSGKEFAISANGTFFITNSETPNPVSATIRKTLCEHQWDNGTITQEAKCETNGVKTYTCLLDTNHTYTEAIAATGHKEEEIPAVPATCTEGGLTAGVKCSGCDAIFTEQQPIEALGHDEIAHDAQAPTCTEIGWNAYVTCSRCDYTTYEELEALGHDEIAHDAQAPTCTAIGWNAYVTCSRCDYTTYEEIAALDHDEIAHDAQAPACTEIGWDAYVTCSRCDYTTYEEKTALGHDEIAHDAQAPTCTAIGWDAYVTCSRCDYTTYEELEALGHDEIAHDAQAPTCTAIGWDAYVTCSRCDYTTYEELESLDHDEIAHDAQAPTCTAIGWDAYMTCSRCDFTTYKEKAALGHSHKAVVTAPTVTNKGYTTYTCVCGDSYVQDYVDPVAGDNAVMKEESVVGLAGTTAKTLLEQVTVGVKLLGMDGKEKAVDARIGTGDKLVLPDGTEIVISVLGDIDGNGAITTADARLVLRKAVNLETFSDAQDTAANINSAEKVDVAHARMILRAAVSLEKAEDWFKAMAK